MTILILGQSSGGFSRIQLILIISGVDDLFIPNPKQNGRLTYLNYLPEPGAIG
jgi:hypothetical protein